MANTLYDYYQGKLPDLAGRAKIFEQQGLGSAVSYQGTTDQNTALLAKLQAQPSAGVVTVGPTSPLQPQTPQFPNLSPSAPNQEVLDKKSKLDAMLGQLKDLQTQLASAKSYEAGLGQTGGEIPSAVLSQTPEEAQREGRITNLEASAFAPPTQTYADIYKSAYDTSGLADVKTKMEAIDTKINTARDNLVQAEQGITENPWLTETGRVGRIKTLYDMAEKQIGNLIDQRNQLNTLYTSGVSQAENLATKTQADELAGRQLKQQELDYLIKAKASQTPDKGTPQLKTDASGELTWLYPDGTSVKTGVMEQGKEITGGLTPAQINTTVNSIASAFDNEPLVKEFNTVNSYVTMFNSLGESATDDQARIYAFAKVMDPNSVVRESEYKTVQEYSQALLKAYGVNVKRFFTDIGALTPEARTSMAETLKTKLTTQKALYDNVSSEYQRQINDALAGKTRTITDYSKTSQPPTGSSGITSGQTSSGLKWTIE